MDQGVESRNERRQLNDKLIRRLLLIIIVADPERFTLKDKPVTYTKAFVELYNQKNRGQVHEIYEIIEFEKMYTLIAKNPYNLIAHQIIEISSFLYTFHMILWHQNRVVFYVNNYIDWNQFSKLYDSDQIKKGLKNTDAVAHKLKPALIKAINHKLKVVDGKGKK